MFFQFLKAEAVFGTGSSFACYKALNSTISLSVVAEPSWTNSSSSSFSPPPSSPGSPPKGSLGNLLVGIGNPLGGRDRHPRHFGHVDELALADASTRFEIPSDLADKTELFQELHCLYSVFQQRPAELNHAQALEPLQLCFQPERRLKQPNSPAVAHKGLFRNTHLTHQPLNFTIFTAKDRLLILWILGTITDSEPR